MCSELPLPPPGEGFKKMPHFIFPKGRMGKKRILKFLR